MDRQICIYVNCFARILSQNLKFGSTEYVQLKWLGAQHPPFIVLLNGFVYELFGVHLLYARFVTLFFALGILVLTYQLGRIFYDATTGVLAAFAFATFPLFLRLGTTSMLDIQVTFFALLGLYFGVIALRNQSYQRAIAAGFALGLGLVTKYTMVLMAPVVLCYFVLQLYFLVKA
ncbi:glycosyltransferase family 39 protein [Chloroflexi bacterium TSY]|nr:glycosyltransferase family 39 protein [Chloroflexi bacterium TSY]